MIIFMMKIKDSCTSSESRKCNCVNNGWVSNLMLKQIKLGYFTFYLLSSVSFHTPAYTTELAQAILLCPLPSIAGTSSCFYSKRDRSDFLQILMLVPPITMDSLPTVLIIHRLGGGSPLYFFGLLKNLA